jgi:DUF4097 and DUF4098 domain-containing protein YvlB
MKLRLRLATGLLLAAMIPAGAAAEQSTGPFAFNGKLSFNLAAGADVHVSTINGDVHVERGAGSTFTARYEKSGSGDLNAVRVLAQHTANGGVEICVRYDSASDCHADSNNANSNDTRVDITVAVPAGTHVDVGTVNGKIEARADGLVTARSVNGRVDIDAADVDEVETVNGAIDIRLHDARSRHALRVKTVNGAIALHVPAASGLNVHASVLNGNITIDGLTAKRPEYGPGASADGRLGDGRREVELKALNGNIGLERAS